MNQPGVFLANETRIPGGAGFHFVFTEGGGRVIFHPCQDGHGARNKGNARIPLDS